MQNLDYPLSTFNNAADGIGDMLRILPYVVQGTGPSDRIGDTINLKSLSLMGHMVVNPTTVEDRARQRIMVRMVLCQPKAFGNYTYVNQSTIWLGTVLKNGASYQGLDGSIKSMYLPLNTEAIHVFAQKKIVLRSDSFTGLSTQFATALFSMRMKVKSKKVKYTYSGSEPEAFAPVLLVSYAFMDGSAASVLSTSLSLTFNVMMKYEDP